MHRIRSQSGFSLIEMIVALAVFTIVITITLGALLMLIGTNQQLQNEQSVMTNLSFALDSMTREIRTGTEYYCDAQNTQNGGSKKTFQDGSDLDTHMTADCPRGNVNGSGASKQYQGLSFIEGGHSITGTPGTRIVYFFDGASNKIYRRVSGGASQSIVSSGIYITNAEFFVSGSEDSADDIQPTVTIVIKAKESASADKTYHIETTVTQRTLDI